jgi:hypothetical protein
MTHRVFKYDVAFSFSKGDEDLAVRISTLLQGRIETFVPSREERWMTDTDFEGRINRVFGSEARMVVVLYRDTWGKAGINRLEEAVLRNRVHCEGHDFLLIIPIDAPTSLPLWLSKKQVWSGFDRWGAEGIAAVIESRVQQAGGTVPRETPLGRAQRLDRDLASEEARQRLLSSQEGVHAAHSEISKLFEEIERIVKGISEETRKVAIRIDRDENHLIFSAHGLSLEVSWFLRSQKTLEESSLQLMLWRGLLSVHGVVFEKPKKLERREFSFDCKHAGLSGWREKEGNSFLTSSDLAEECVNLLLEQIRQIGLGKG